MHRKSSILNHFNQIVTFGCAGHFLSGCPLCGESLWLTAEPVLDKATIRPPKFGG